MNDRIRFSLDNVRKGIKPSFLGLSTGILISCIASNPTWKSWVFWGLAYIIIIVIAFMIPYLMYPKLNNEE